MMRAVPGEAVFGFCDFHWHKLSGAIEEVAFGKFPEEDRAFIFQGEVSYFGMEEVSDGFIWAFWCCWYFVRFPIVGYHDYILRPSMTVVLLSLRRMFVTIRSRVLICLVGSEQLRP